MRDFRDAKAMAHTLRAALTTIGFKITISQSLELIAQAFGIADWNTPSAAIRPEQAAAPESVSCSFCGKSQHEARRLYEGGFATMTGRIVTGSLPRVRVQRTPKSCVFICNECVAFCAQVDADRVDNAKGASQQGVG
jgi:hypothetical protein